ncbi:acetyltransferase [Fulvivirgaceae bacterium BMA10]|uniref:Acetyltransferase n=1 Tax=Splendidivirga corallicola TaxID=3051826 RepID=A0ABT8KQG7_9BACT|nr:acetyltransferase [Fulvivirgaceae bacterium BMA10]
MKYNIDNIKESEYSEVVDVWEASVRATHHFLKEEDIQFFKPLILNEFLKAVTLSSARNEIGRIVGFMGVANEKLEMLFIHPDMMGQGIGKQLLRHAIENLNIDKVDVNEDNQTAVGFYKYFGFRAIKRSPLDGMGKPYPILHMELTK